MKRAPKSPFLPHNSPSHRSATIRFSLLNSRTHTHTTQHTNTQTHTHTQIEKGGTAVYVLEDEGEGGKIKHLRATSISVATAQQNACRWRRLHCTVRLLNARELRAKSPGGPCSKPNAFESGLDLKKSTSCGTPTHTHTRM